MFTIRVERSGRRDVFEAESYSVSKAASADGSTRILLVGGGANTPPFIDVANGDSAFVMNVAGKTVDSVRSSIAGGGRAASVFRTSSR